MQTTAEVVKKSHSRGRVSQQAYEKAFAQLFGEDVHAFAFWKGRVALYAILKALGVGPGDEVILPGFTCVVVPNAIRLTSARPVYVDIPPYSYNIEAGAIERALTLKTKAVIIQHTFGIPAVSDDLKSLIAAKGLPLVEDCAHSLGTKLNGRPLGVFGQAAFFSSQWSKSYTTGLGGIAITHNPALAARIADIQSRFRPAPVKARLQLFVQYQVFKYFFSPRIYWFAHGILHLLGRLGLFVGSSSNEELDGVLPTDHDYTMSRFQQQTGLRQLAGLEKQFVGKRANSEVYDQGLSAAGWPVTQRTEETVLLRYPVRVANKTELLEKAKAARIELGSWFETPLHPIPLAAHAKFDYILGQCPNAERAAAEVINLPLHSKVTLQEASRILDFFLENATPAARE